MSSRARSGAPLALAVWTVLAALTSLAPAPLSAAVEPFYLGLYADGAQAYERGEFLAAARQLRLACFGMLDDPPLLGGCLARLAVAQAQSGDGDGFRESFRRLAEAEDQFQGYTKAELPAAVRAAFERLAATRIPAELLGASPSFSRLKIQSEAARIEALPLKARREELARKLAAEPKNPAWKVLLGRLEIADGHPAAALAQAQAALALAAEDGSAHCLRGLAQARLGACAQGLADLETCAETNQFATPAAARLGCLVEVQAWDRARAFVASLTPALREDRDLARLAHRIKSDRETAKPADLPAPSVPTATAAAPPSTPDPRPLPPTQQTPAPPASGLAPHEIENLAKARELLTPTASTRDLKRARDLAKGVADARPEDREAQLLAAEAAYRNSRWDEAATYFHRGGDPGDDHPERLFYLAVSLFESGNKRGAAAALQRALPNLQASPFIDEYTKKILGEPIR